MGSKSEDSATLAYPSHTVHPGVGQAFPHPAGGPFTSPVFGALSQLGEALHELEGAVHLSASIMCGD